MREMRSRALSGYVAALVLVVITMSLSYVVYQGARSFDPDKQAVQPVFENQVATIEASPLGLLRVQVNSSRPESSAALEIDGSSSRSGILFVGGTGQYGVSPSSLCRARATTFFSVLSPSAGELHVSTDGQAWIDGAWGDTLSVGAGWNEVMISDGTVCSVVTSGGTLTGPGPSVSGLPIVGALPSASFTLFIPSGSSGFPAQALLVFGDGSYDQIA